MYNRKLFGSIQKQIWKWNVIIVYGARQVGKTTLVKKLLEENKDGGKYIDCDQIENRQELSTQNANKLKAFLWNHKLIILDEAQRVENIWLNLKIIHDNFPDIQIIATGSSSFDLANKINEPLTGRSIEFLLLPLSVSEILPANEIKLPRSNIDQILRFGLYPNIYNQTDEISRQRLDSISWNYLYKDILEWENIKKSEKIIELLQLLALQIWQQVSYHEIWQKLWMSSITIEKYIILLEKSFIIFRLKSFAKNIRNEIWKSVKIYFWDLWILNSLIWNFQKTDLRVDIWWLWENFCIVERLKYTNNNRDKVRSFFWRTYSQQEVDYLEEYEDWILAFEFKWNEKKKSKLPQSFENSYKIKEFKIINRENYYEMLS